MRIHRDWPLAQLWAGRRYPQTIFDPKHLVSAQLEPMVRRDIPGTAMTLRLDDGTRGLSIPMIFLDETALYGKLRDVCIWPQAVARMASDDTLLVLEDAVRDWMMFALTAKGAADRPFHLFSEAHAELTAQAQNFGLYGAGPLEASADALQCAQYAGRFLSGAQVAVGAPFINVGAILAHRAGATVFLDLPEPVRAAAERWFDMPLPAEFSSGVKANFVLGAAAAPAVAVHEDARILDCVPFPGAVRVARVQACMSDDIARFGEERDQSAPLFMKVRERFPVEPVLPRLPAVGGSTGTIAFLLRDDLYENPGADGDAARCLRDALNAEGFQVELFTEFRKEYFSDAAVIHVFGLWNPEHADLALQFAKERGIAYVVTPFFEDAAVTGRWGSKASRTLLGAFEDETDLERALTQLAEQRVEVDGLSAQVRIDDGQDGRRREILRRADIVTVCGAAEREAVQKFSGRRRRTLEVGPFVACHGTPASIAAIVGDTPYALIEASAEARYNLGLTVRAVATLDIPAVIIAAPVDRRFYRSLQALCGPQIAVMPFADEATLEALYGRAGVYVDTAWYGDGVHRLAHAVAHGQECIVSRSRFLPEALEARAVRVDPWSERSIGSGVAQAWERALGNVAHDMHEIAQCLNPSQNLRSYVMAYAQAGEHLESTGKVGAVT